MALVETRSVDLSQGKPLPAGASAVHCPTCYRPARYVYSFNLGRGAAPHQQIFCQTCADFARELIGT